MLERTCCFFGHREINSTEELVQQLYCIIEKLISGEKVDTFLFGSKSAFNSLCHEVVSDLKEKYPHIRRIYVRAEFPYIDRRYTDFLLEQYEQTYFPEQLLLAGRAIYVQRNYEMIDKSRFCVVYCQESQTPKTRKSGTKLALDYAQKKDKAILIVPSPTV